MEEKKKAGKLKRKLTQKEAAIKGNKQFRTFAKDLVKKINDHSQEK